MPIEVTISICEDLNEPIRNLKISDGEGTALNRFGFWGCCLALVALTMSPAQSGGSNASLQHYYSTLQASLTAKGFLRMERNPSNTSLTPDALVREFNAIALSREYSSKSHRLLRWEDGVRFQLSFGPSVDSSVRGAYRKSVGQYISRLGRITGHPMGMSTTQGNFHVLVVNNDEVRGMGAHLKAMVPGISKRAVQMATRMDRNKFCMVITVPHTDPARGIRSAVAILRAEHTGAMRQACIEEELAQGLGLPNDYSKATASIFNDDTEYALLTRNDEMLLKLLYDRRLRSGMTGHECVPIVESVADGLL